MNLASTIIAKYANDPNSYLRQFGRVQDLATGQPIAFDPAVASYHCQQTILHYFTNTPRDKNDFTKWLVLLGPRQVGKSTVPEMCALVKTMFNPGWDHLCLADDVPRAQYLHGRVHYTYLHLPEQVRTPAIRSIEVNQKSFDPRVGGRLRIGSTRRKGGGIGETPSSLHGSEIPFHTDAASAFNLRWPSLINRRNSLVIMESTPAPAWYPSVEYWRDLYETAKKGKARWTAAFFPFFDSKLNVRPWPKNTPLELEEIRLLEKYGPLGLTKENLWFRREMFDTDVEISRDPSLFNVFYPFDDITCWQSAAGGLFKEHMLQKHIDRGLIEWEPDQVEATYKEYDPSANYIMGVDPTGYAARDHAGVEMLACWSNRVEEVYAHAAHADPDELFKRIYPIAQKYRAWVAIESNGVGQALISKFRDANYPKIINERPRRPGIATTAPRLNDMVSLLQDLLMGDMLCLHGRPLMAQLQTYKNDKITERTEHQEMVARSSGGGKRRARHHWDSVSALLVACYARRFMSIPMKEYRGPDWEPPPPKQFTYDEQRAFRLRNPRGPQQPQGKQPRWQKFYGRRK